MFWFSFTLTFLYWINYTKSITLLETPSFYGGDNPESEVFQILNAKEYLPHEDDLPISTVLKNEDNDATYILSKLSDEELIKLLSQEPKTNEYDLNDLVQVATGANTAKASSNSKFVLGKEGIHKAFFKLDNKEVEPFDYNNEADPKYNALQKLNNLLYSRPQQQNSDEDDDRDEMLFDALVAQLKSLCCKKNKPRANVMNNIKSLPKKTMSNKKSKLLEKITKFQGTDKPKEHIFLIINDEIRSQNDSEDLIVVDPESLSKNCSVLLLGPITTPLSEVQLRLVMTRIATELSKPEYLPLLRKISEGSLENSNIGLMKSLITGSDSRRYIKPHRCNHQSKLARVYGSPKWLICTGYLNINTPSLYD